MVGGLGRDRVDELLLDLVPAQVRLGDGARDRPPVPRAVVRDHVGGADQPGGLHRDQFRVAGPSPTPYSVAAQSSSLAIALTAATVIALPPRRPCTTRYSRPEAASASFDSAAPMNPTGMPSTAAGAGAPAADQLEQPEQRGRRVADRHHRPVQARAATGRARPPTGSSRAAAASAGTDGSPSVQMTSLPAGSRRRVMPEATICASHSIGAPASSAARAAAHDAVAEPDVGGQVDHPARVDHPDDDPRHVGREARQVGLGPDGGERAAVDLRAVPDVVKLRQPAYPSLVAVTSTSVAAGPPAMPARSR